MFSARMMQTVSCDVSPWRMNEIDRRYAERRSGGIASEGIWRVLDGPMKTLRIGMNGDGESGRKRPMQVYLENCS